MYICLLALLGTLAFAQTKMPPPANIKVDFEKDVQPILAQKCYSCHGEDAQQSGLRLDTRQLALRGGDYGPVIIVGKSAESKLIKRVVNGDGGLQMPPTGPLAVEEISILRAWIDQGAEFRLAVSQEAPAKPGRSEAGESDRGGPGHRRRRREEDHRGQSGTREREGCEGLDAAASCGGLRHSGNHEAAA